MSDTKYQCPKCKVPQSLGCGDCPHCFDDHGELVKLELLSVEMVVDDEFFKM